MTGGRGFFTLALHERGEIMFWKERKLGEMSPEQWESLCDGCARCCLVKFEEEDTGEILFTRAACKLLELGTCRCSDYENRTSRVPDCVGLDAKNVGELHWLPTTCAYRLVAEGKDLPWWHPLVSGRAESVEEAGISVKGQIVSEEGLSEAELVAKIWKLPKARRKNFPR